MDRTVLTDPLALEHFDFVTPVLPGHDLWILFFQSGLDNRLELFQETVPPFPERASVVGPDVGNRVDCELGVGADVHRIGNEGE